jgi:hypothetical protein
MALLISFNLSSYFFRIQGENHCSLHQNLFIEKLQEKFGDSQPLTIKYIRGFHYWTSEIRIYLKTPKKFHLKYNCLVMAWPTFVQMRLSHLKIGSDFWPVFNYLTIVLASQKPIWNSDHCSIIGLVFGPVCLICVWTLDNQSDYWIIDQSKPKLVR